MSQGTTVTVFRVWNGKPQEYEMRVPDRPLRPHGTKAARMRHWRRGEPYCLACSEYDLLSHREKRAAGAQP